MSRLLTIYFDSTLKDSLSGDVKLMPGGEFDLPKSEGGSYYRLKLSGIDYDKRMFAPCELNLQFTVQKNKKEGDETLGPLPKVLKEQFIDGFTSVDVVSGSSDSSNSSTLSSSSSSTSVPQYLLKNCYVYSVRCGGMGSGSGTCSFKCYSIDHKLTLGKGCGVFTGKKFVEDIITQVKSLFEGEVDSEVGRLLLMGYSKENKSRILDDSAKKDKKYVAHDSELIHPYLVRYNESWYDFLSRVAHRCGEFLYFEDGKLCLGLPVGTMKKIAGISEFGEMSSSLPSYGDISCDFASDDGDFSSNYVEGILQLQCDGCHYDAQQASDEFLHLVESDDDLKDYSGWWIGIKAFSILQTSKEFISGISSAAYSAADDLQLSYWSLPAMLHSGFNERYTGKNEAVRLSDGVTENLKQNLSSHFYHVIEKLEEKSARGKVSLNLTDRIPEVKLGDGVDIDDGIYDRYVITGIHGSVSYSGTSILHSHYAEGVPLLPTDEISGLTHVVVPACGEVAHIRESEPLEAVVTANDDPLRLGRVKVRFLWQTENAADVSPWLRVAVPFAGSAGSSGGFAMIPDEGEHVMLKFMDGNIERPFVKGSLYFRYREEDDDGKEKVTSHYPNRGRNTDMEPRYFLPAYKTRAIASKKGHCLMFKDLEDTSIMAHAFPLLGTINDFMNVKNYQSTMNRQPIPYGIIKGGGINICDGTGICQIDISPDSRCISIDSPFGSVDISAFTGMTVNAPNGDIRIKGKNVYIEAGNNLSLRSGTNIKPIKLPGMGAMIFGTITGMLLSKIGAGLCKSMTGVDLNGALDLSYLRCLLEIIFRPVEGTLSVHSNRNTVVTAGKGEVTIPRSLLASTGKMTIRGKKGFGVYGPVKTPMEMNYLIELYLRTVDNFYDVYVKERYAAIIERANSLLETIEGLLKDGLRVKLKKDYLKKDYFLTNMKVVIDKIVRTPECGKIEEVLVEMSKDAKTFYKKFSKQYNELSDIMQDYHKKIYDLSVLQKLFDQLNNSGISVSVNQFPLSYQTAFGNLERDRFFQLDPNSEQDLINDRKKVMKRSVVCQLLLSSKSIKLIKANNKISINNEILKSGLNPAKLLGSNKVIDPRDRAFVSSIDDLEGYILGKGGFKWGDFENAMVYEKEEEQSGNKVETKHFFSSVLGGITKQLGGGLSYDMDKRKLSFAPQVRKIVNWNGESGPRAFSEISNVGNVMISDSDGVYRCLNRTSTGWDEVSNNGSPASIWEKIKDL